MLGGISQLLAAARAREVAGTEGALSLGVRLAALAQDLTDGILDGQQGSQALTLSDGTVIPSLLPALQTTLAQVANAFAMNPPLNTGLDRTGFQQLAAVAPVRITPPPRGNFTGTNTAPVPAPDSMITTVARAVTIPVLANDRDPDGDPLTGSTVTQGRHGTVTIPHGGQVVRYTPTAAFQGTDMFTYTIRDGHGGTATTTVAVTVTPLYPGQKWVAAVGEMPDAAMVADVNGDGHPDVITANTGSNDVAVLLGQGDGTFEPEQRVATGLFLASMLVADVNSDGRPDLVINSDSSPGDVSVLLGQGDGTFQPPQRVAAGGPYQAVRVADVTDVNGDGRPDLVMNNNFPPGGVSVLLGHGDGTFEPEQRFATGTGPTAVVVVDVNGDGYPDLITANTDSNDVSVLVNILPGVSRR